MKSYLHCKKLDEVKGDSESLDKVEKDENRNDKYDNYDKDSDANNINANNDKVDNPKEIRPTYYSNTDKCPVCNNYFVTTTTDMLNVVYDTNVIDVGVIYFEEYRYMIHNICVTIFCRTLESTKCPRCDSVGLFLDFQSYNEQINMLKDIYISNVQRDTIKNNDVVGNDNVDNATSVLFLLMLMLVMIMMMIMLMIVIITMMATITMIITMITITIMMIKLMIIKMYELYINVNLWRQLLQMY